MLADQERSRDEDKTAALRQLFLFQDCSASESPEPASSVCMSVHTHTPTSTHMQRACDHITVDYSPRGCKETLHGVA